jgi:hypothetical protein
MHRSATFRDFGINPREVQPPPPEVRCSMPAFHAFGQYVATLLMGCLPIVLAGLFTWSQGIPLFVLGLVAGAGAGIFVGSLGARGTYAWVECRGRTLRARHLYVPSIIERSITDIAELRTILYPTVTPHLSMLIATKIASAWLGPVRGIEVRFRDGKTSMQIMRSDPTMRNAQELIEAIVYQMANTASLGLSVTERNGHPIIESIYWEGDPLRNSDASPDENL